MLEKVVCLHEYNRKKQQNNLTFFSTVQYKMEWNSVSAGESLGLKSYLKNFKIQKPYSLTKVSIKLQTLWQDDILYNPFF